MRQARGADILHAAPLSKPGGRLSVPVDLPCLIDFKSCSTSSSNTGRNLNLHFVLLGIGVGGIQTKFYNGVIVLRNVVTMDAKKLQNPSATLLGSFVFPSCKSKECTDVPMFALDGYIDIMAFKNLFGLILLF